MREGGGGGVLGRTYCIQSQTTTTVCVVWTHVADCPTSPRSLAAHSRGDGHLSPLIDVVAGRSRTIVCGGWALVVGGGGLLPWAGVGVASSSLFVMVVRWLSSDTWSWLLFVVIRCSPGSFHAVKETPRVGMRGDVGHTGRHPPVGPQGWCCHINQVGDDGGGGGTYCRYPITNDDDEAIVVASCIVATSLARRSWVGSWLWGGGACGASCTSISGCWWFLWVWVVIWEGLCSLRVVVVVVGARSTSLGGYRSFGQFGSFVAVVGV